MLSCEKKRCLEKLDEKVKHHTRETEFHQLLIVHFLNCKRSGEELFSYLMRDEVMKDLYGKVEYHTKQRELYWEMHQAVAKGKTDEQICKEEEGGYWDPSDNVNTKEG